MRLGHILDDIKCNLRKEQRTVMEQSWYTMHRVLTPIQVCPAPWVSYIIDIKCTVMEQSWYTMHRALTPIQVCPAPWVSYIMDIKCTVMEQSWYTMHKVLTPIQVCLAPWVSICIIGTVMEQSWYTMHKVLTPIQERAFPSWGCSRLALPFAWLSHKGLPVCDSNYL